MKQFIKKKFRVIVPFIILPEFIWAWLKYVRFSGIVFQTGKVRLKSLLIAKYHVVEKGLTMPQPRPGFGKLQIKELIDLCRKFSEQYGKEDSQLQHAVGVLAEYKRFQGELRSELTEDLSFEIEAICNEIKSTPGKQIPASSRDYFRAASEPFSRFAASRYSVRNYTDQDVDEEKVRNAVRIALKTPSSCNRQGTKVHLERRPEVIRKVLAIQAGNRGFGHLATAVILVVGDLRASLNPYDFNLVYMDGGMFAMSLMYALHYEKLAACPLNCYLSQRKLNKISSLCGFEEGQFPIMMMTVGHPPTDFKIAASPRVEVDEVFRVRGGK